MGIRHALHHRVDDTLSPTEVLAAKALMAVHLGTVVLGLAAGGRFLMLAAFGAAMAPVMGAIQFRRPRAGYAAAAKEPLPEP